jgi:hypothetical protein
MNLPLVNLTLGIPDEIPLKKFRKNLFIMIASGEARLEK